MPEAWRGRRVELLWSSRSEATLWQDGRIVQGLNTGGAGERPDARARRRAGPRSSCRSRSRATGCSARARRRRSSSAASSRSSTWMRGSSPSTSRRCARSRSDTDDLPWAGHLREELSRFCDERDPAILAALYERAERFIRARARGDRARAHRHGVAVAARRDVPEVPANVLDPDALHGRVPGVPLRVLAGAAVRVDQGAKPGPVGADPREGRRRTVRAGRRLVGRARLQPPVRRVARPPVPPRPAVLRATNSAAATASSGARTRSATAGQLPQILREVGITRFLTQKLSWNRFTKPEHHTFVWQGDDGSEVLGHFPPADTYNSDANVRRAAQSASDCTPTTITRGRACSSSATATAAAGRRSRCSRRCARAGDLQGLPRTHQATAEEFFTALEAEPAERPVVVGELYFEYHRGVYTSQAAVKRGNRRVQQLLHDVEFLATAARRRVPARRARPALEAAPAAAVPRHPPRLVDRARLRGRRARLRRARAPTRSALLPERRRAREHDAVRPPRRRRRRARRVAAVRRRPCRRRRRRGARRRTDARERAPACDARRGRPAAQPAREGDAAARRSPRPATASSSTTTIPWRSTPGTSTRTRSSTGRDAPPFDRRIRSRRRRCARRSVSSDDGFDADGAARRRLAPARVPRRDRLAQRATSCSRSASRSPCAHRARRTRCRSATPSARRTASTSRDAAQYEVPAQRFADLSEHGFGVALLNDSKYGYSCRGGELRLSLLRVAEEPRPRGRHGIGMCSPMPLMPHAGGWREAGVVRAGGMLQRAAAADARPMRVVRRGRRREPRARHDQACRGLGRDRAAPLRAARRARQSPGCASPRRSRPRRARTPSRTTSAPLASSRTARSSSRTGRTRSSR